MPTPMLVLIPGLGTDQRLFEPQRAISARVEALGWIEPEAGEPLDRYAGRLAAKIEPGEAPLYLGGVSLGGMIALEMARHLPVRGVFVIGGARTGKDLPAWLRGMRHPLSILQPWAVEAAVRVIAPRVKFGDPISEAQADLLRTMLREMPGKTLKWQCLAASRWELGDPPDVPIHTIHGREDPVLRRDGYKVDEYIEGGGHLINLTHAQRVNAFIEERIRDTEQG